ncbi:MULTISPECIES: helix-turn-helix domain-containing protein [Bifidobacterium]|uniref:helix-turn-helix domain-containing protein n=1 Tax=Bifidobacterium TaxID=1678 RepID=UPI0013E8EFDC
MGWPAVNPRVKLTVSQAARYLHVSRRTMQRMRDQGTGPAYFRARGRVLGLKTYDCRDVAASLKRWCH